MNQLFPFHKKHCSFIFIEEFVNKKERGGGTKVNGHISLVVHMYVHNPSKDTHQLDDDDVNVQRKVQIFPVCHTKEATNLWMLPWAFLSSYYSTTLLAYYLLMWSYHNSLIFIVTMEKQTVTQGKI